MNVAWVVLHCNRRIGARERRQLIPHVRFQVPFLGPESQLKSGFACAGLLCNLEKEVGLVPGLDTNGLSWIRTFQRRLQLLAEEGEMSSLLEGSVAPELPEF